jgi:hypothetical protein
MEMSTSGESLAIDSPVFPLIRQLAFHAVTSETAPRTPEKSLPSFTNQITDRIWAPSAAGIFLTCG